jgi:hypothetical protein
MHRITHDIGFILPLLPIPRKGLWFDLPFVLLDILADIETVLFAFGL